MARRARPAQKPQNRQDAGVTLVALLAIILQATVAGAAPYPGIRKTIPAGIRAGTDGPQIHPSCIRDSDHRNRLQNLLNDTFKGLDRSLFRCSKRYPALSFYAEEARIQLKRLVMTCADLPRFSRKNFVLPSGSPGIADALSFLQPSSREGIEIADPRRPIISRDPVIVLNRELIDRYADAGYTLMVLLRMTSANPSLEKTETFWIINGCQSFGGANKLDLLNALCSKDTIPENMPLDDAEGALSPIRPNAEREIVTKIKRCSRDGEEALEIGCVRPLMETFPSPETTGYLLSRGVPEVEARKFCERLFDRDYCDQVNSNKNEHRDCIKEGKAPYWQLRQAAESLKTLSPEKKNECQEGKK